MQPFDDYLPAELDPQNQEVIEFLQMVNRSSVRAISVVEEEKQVLSRVRHDLFEVSETTLLSKQYVLSKPEKGWSRRFAVLAAAVVISLLVSSILLLFHQERHPTPLAAQGSQAIYALSGGWLQKFDSQNGKLLWKSQIHITTNQTNSSIFTPASNGTVYITTNEKISALKASDGSFLWSKNIPGEIVDRTIFANNKLFILTQQESAVDDIPDSLQAFDALSGREIWQYKQDGLFLSFAVDNNAVYGGVNLRSTSASKNDPYTKFDLFALKAIDGSSLWHIHMDDPLLVSTSGEIISANGKVYVEANTLEETSNSAHGYSHLYVYDANSGSFLWRTSDALNPILGTVLSGQQTVFAVSGASLYALYEQNGQLLWRYANQSGGAWSCSLVSQANTLYCLETEVSSTYLVKLDASDGQVKNKYLVEHFGSVGIQVTPSRSTISEDAPSMLLFPILLPDTNNSYVVTSMGSLDAFDNQTGERLWTTYLMGVPGQVNLMLGG